MCDYCAASGEAWTDALERDLTMHRLFARFRYWRRAPPAHVLLRVIAEGLGVIEFKKPFKASSVESIKDVARRFGSNG